MQELVQVTTDILHVINIMMIVLLAVTGGVAGYLVHVIFRGDK